VIGIAAGVNHSLALTRGGGVIAWGCGTIFGIDSDFGQCRVPGSEGLGVTAIAAGYAHSLALEPQAGALTRVLLLASLSRAPITEA
jgi:alpha-tubulin suppressor-like RCC1 family protein